VSIYNGYTEYDTVCCSSRPHLVFVCLSFLYFLSIPISPLRRLIIYPFQFKHTKRGVIQLKRTGSDTLRVCSRIFASSIGLSKRGEERERERERGRGREGERERERETRRREIGSICVLHTYRAAIESHRGRRIEVSRVPGM